jgi:hypothetical protein
MEEGEDSDRQDHSCNVYGETDVEGLDLLSKEFGVSLDGIG